jgi:diadenylate cyclase
MPDLYSPIVNSLPQLTPIAVLDILLVAVLTYQFIMIVRGRRAAQILAGIGVLAMVYLVAVWIHLELLRTILATIAPYTAFALIVMFQSEIRRMLARIGRRRLLGLSSRLARRESVTEIVLAVQHLAQHQTGALVVMERESGLRTFIESGVALDAQLSRDLLLSIFHPGGAMHDGAAIVQGDRVAAAACFLPLTTNPTLSRQLGTRHRAAIGVTEEADCLAVVVSEETGRISLCAFGEIAFDIPPDELAQRIEQHFAGQRRAALAPRRLAAHQPSTEAKGS